MSTPAHQFTVDEHTLVFAFRYALGRTSAAPSIVADQLKAHWPRLTSYTRDQIRREIREAIDGGVAGHSCDVQTWRTLAALPDPGSEQTERGCGDDDDEGCPSREERQ